MIPTPYQYKKQIYQLAYNTCISGDVFSLFLPVFPSLEKESHVSPEKLQIRLASQNDPEPLVSLPHLPSAAIIDVQHHAQFYIDSL